MLLNSFYYGVAFSKSIETTESYKTIGIRVLNAVRGDGNVTFFTMFPKNELAKKYEPQMGKRSGDRIKHVPMSDLYTENRFINALSKHTVIPVLYFSEALHTHTVNNIYVINQNDLESVAEKFLDKYSALQIDQDNLPRAFKYCSLEQPVAVSLRDPYFNFGFVKELIKSSFFENGTLEYHFTRVNFEPDEWQRIKTDLHTGTLSRPLFKQRIKDRFVASIKEKIGKLSLHEKTVLNSKIRLLGINKSEKMSLCLHLLKDCHNQNTPEYFDDSSAHWHHRFVLIKKEMTKTVYESSHSFIHRKRLPYYLKDLEPLHFRHSDEIEFNKFHKAFDAPECFTFPLEP